PARGLVVELVAHELPVGAVARQVHAVHQDGDDAVDRGVGGQFHELLFVARGVPYLDGDVRHAPVGKVRVAGQKERPLSAGRKGSSNKKGAEATGPNSTGAGFRLTSPAPPAPLANAEAATPPREAGGETLAGLAACLSAPPSAYGGRGAAGRDRLGMAPVGFSFDRAPRRFNRALRRLALASRWQDGPSEGFACRFTNSLLR